MNTSTTTNGSASTSGTNGGGSGAGSNGSSGSGSDRDSSMFVVGPTFIPASGASNDDTLAAFNAALAALPAGGSTALPYDTTVSAKPTNPNGDAVTGNGRLFLPLSDGTTATGQASTGLRQQLNTYTRGVWPFFGKDFLYAVKHKALNGTGTIGAEAFGDSTMVGTTVGPRVQIQQFWPFLARVRGLRLPMVVNNRAVTGTSIGDMQAVGYITAATDLVVIKYGINDGGKDKATRLATFRDTLRAKLAEIRASQFGATSRLSILLIGPNGTADSPNGRDEEWYESIHGIYLQAAEDYECAYVDGYALTRHARGGSRRGWDDSFGDGRTVHLFEELQSYLFGETFNFLFSEEETALVRTNMVQNLAGNLATRDATLDALTYDYGITVERADGGKGWPLDGAVVTIRHADDVTSQELTGFANAQPIRLFRRWIIASKAWTPWTGTRAALTLAGTWVDHDPAAWGPASAQIAEDGTVRLTGLVRGGSTAAGSTVGTLPVGLRPVYNTRVVVGTDVGSCTLDILADGTIRIVTGGSGVTYLSLSSVSFSAY